MKNKKIYLFCIAMLGLFISCSDENPIETEQYIKQIYIIDAVNIAKSYDIPYRDGIQETYISIGTGGSLNLDKDVRVVLESNNQTIEWYNKKYMIDSYLKYRKLDDALYDIPSMETTIRAGQTYGRLPFTINASEINCDSLYVLTFKIKSVSEYQKVTTDTVLMMNLNMVNDYSGTYQMAITKYTIDPVTGDELSPSSMNLTRTLKAIDAGAVRFFNETVADHLGGYRTYDEYFESVKNNCVVFEYISDSDKGKIFKAKGWKDFLITDSEILYTYDSVIGKGTFTFSYDYEKGGITYRVRGMLVE